MTDDFGVEEMSGRLSILVTKTGERFSVSAHICCL